MSPDQFHEDALAIQHAAWDAIERIDRLSARFERDRFWRRITFAILFVALVWVGPVDAHRECVRANESRASIRRGIGTALDSLVATADDRPAAEQFVRGVKAAVAEDIPDRDCSWWNL